MKIKQFNEMKAYLLKPNRLFTSKQNKIGGGVIQGKDLGTREGFFEPKKVDSPKGEYSVRFPYKKDYGNPKFRGTQFGTEEEIKQLIKDRAAAADASYKEGVAKASQIAKEKAEADIKKTVDSFIKEGDYENFRIKPYESQLKRKLPSGNVRQSKGGRVNPKTFQYIRDMLDEGDFENLSRITGRSKEELIQFNNKIPKKGVIDVEQRAKSAKESFPEERKLTEEQRQLAEKKVQTKRGGRLDKTTGYAKFISGSDDFPFHHIKQIGGEVPLKRSDLMVIDKVMNSKLSPYNKKLNDIADAISEKITESFQAMNAKDESRALKILKEVDVLNNQAEEIVKSAQKNLPPEFKPLIGFNKFTARTDEYGFPLDDKVVVEPVGGGVKKGVIEKDLTKYTRKEVQDLQKEINRQVKVLELQRDIPSLTTASKIDRPEAAVERDMFAAFNERISKIKNIPVTEVQEDVSKVTKLLNETAGKLNSGTDPVFLAKYLKAQGEDIAAFGKKYGGDALNKIIKGTTALDLPIFQVAFASMQDWEEDSPLWVTLPAAFTDYTAKTFNLYEKTGGKAKEFGKYLASSFVPRAARSPVFKAVTKFGKGASLAAPGLEIVQGVYKDYKQRKMLPEIARKFNIPIEEAQKGYMNYVRDTIPQDAFDELNVPESPGLEGLKRGLQSTFSFLPFVDDPYKDPNAKQPIEVETPKVDNREFLFGGGVASLFKKAAQVSEALRRVKNSTFEMWNNIRMFGEQEGIAKNLQGFTNIPDKNRKTASIEDLKALKENVPEKYHQDLNIMMRSIEQNNFETAWKEYQKFEKELDPTLKFENIPQEYFPMLDPLNDAFIIKGPRDSFKIGRYKIRTSMDLDPETGKPTGKYQTEKYDTFDPETRTFRDEPVLVGASTEKGKKGFN